MLSVADGLKLFVFLFNFAKLTELKAEAWEKEKELRQKINQMQKDQAERIENLQVDNFVCICSAKPYWYDCLFGPSPINWQASYIVNICGLRYE